MTPIEILDQAVNNAIEHPQQQDVTDAVTHDRIIRLATDTRNRACVRLVLAAMLAKAHQPSIDPRKPYTEINEPGAYSGRSYDETYITSLIQNHRLPANTTTAFLTSALRNINYTLTTDKAIIGRPRELYADALEILASVAAEQVSSEAVLTDTLRSLFQLRDEQDYRLNALQQALRTNEATGVFSSEQIVNLLQQHLNCPRSSRLPVLIVTAAYNTISSLIHEQVKTLSHHNAADLQTGATGDIEITLENDTGIVTVYEMKQKAVSISAISVAIEKISTLSTLQNYIFVTTEPIDAATLTLAHQVYLKTGRIEMTILDCLGFIRHYLHLFHRHRNAFLDEYQKLLLNEPESAVNFALKQAFLALRQAAIVPQTE